MIRIFVLLAFCLHPLLRAAEIQVSAAASLTEALREIGAAYEKQSQDKIHFNFGASSFLARQIEAGAPVDIFFSADEEKMDELEKKNLIVKESRKSLLSNSLVVVVPVTGAKKITSLDSLAEPEVKRVALGDPAVVPAGLYAKALLEKHKLWNRVSPKVIPTDNVRAALVAVETGNVDAAIVYKTDAAISKKSKVAVEIPHAETLGISYPVALTRDSHQPPAAKKFLDYLSSPGAAATFKKFGFLKE